MGRPLSDELQDEKLTVLREQLGETLWAVRIEQARQRERLLSHAAQLCEQGVSKRDIAAACKVKQDTLARWQREYARGGLSGLIKRTGRIAIQRASVPPRARGRVRPTRRALSFVKWAGAKRGSMAAIVHALPDHYGAYFDPFAGSGTVFHELRPTGRVVLGDINQELMTTYQVIRDDVEPLIAALQRHVNTREHFSHIRGIDPAQLSPVECAARFIFLNKTCYNGLYRVNSGGAFNVPYGYIARAHVCDEATLRRWAALLRDVELRTGDYREILSEASAGDLVYLDPPYLRATRSTAGAVRYHARDFDQDAHRELADVFRQLDRRGCHLIASNANLPEVHRLYDGYIIRALTVRRQVNWDASGRANHSELLITNVRRPAVQLELPTLAAMVR
jgi:DNA adenine methylase